MPRLYWIAAAAVIGVEIWAASLMLSPQVSADYRDYYITRSSDCWPRPVTGRYRLGDALSFRDDPAGRAAVRHRQCGWIAPFAAGSYSRGDRARLRFSFAVPPQGVLVAMVAEGYVGLQHLQQRVAVRVNGTRLDDLLFTPENQGFIAIVVGADIAALDPTGVTLQFDFPDRISPAEMGESQDRRQLGMLLQEVMISALPPDQ